jgi:1-acyl-sn-glycerol-3-phosphate acyltransferase
MAALRRIPASITRWPRRIEGTTTDGLSILPFRRGLFHSILNNNVELRTATLRYSIAADNGAATVADDVCWWGDASFGPHLFRCLGLHGVAVRIHFDDTVVEGSDRFALSQNAQARIERDYAELTRQEAGEFASQDVAERPGIARAV